MSSLPQGGFGGGNPGAGPRRRRRPLIIGGVVLVMLVLWTYGALTMGGGPPEETSSRDPQAPSRTTPSRTTPATNPEPTTGSTTLDTQSPTDVPDGTAYAQSTTTATSTPGPATTTPDGRASTPQPDPPSNGAPTDEDTPDTHDHGSHSSTEPGTGAGPVGASNEPASYDPLGTDAGPGDLAPVEEERLRYAAARYITAAYGYSGNDKDAYHGAVNRVVVWPDFFESEGAPEIERYGLQVHDTGTKSGSVLTDLEIIETGPQWASAYAHFDTGSGYDKNGNLTGDTQSYRQFMTLAQVDPGWKVYGVNKIEEVN